VRTTSLDPNALQLNRKRETSKSLSNAELADYSGGDDAMIWGEYGLAPRSPSKVVERFEGYDP